ncbi:MAG TPA: 2-oxoacid:ferredoxin oxidoreductase subunit gamma [candidate division WOR-3 bacterium]|uniref:2-oxoacid:ferredoxin oxidoreductase subunit gamma n=1 Tax=candidate division WOR-3 bacterium TaxID=2052148 RepID=A0A7V0T557_UNCW3|nr:2-oxoacid:ferredoxin oxidoreductase subunit gamma [candidate division WOR-3 bacterium]
MQAEVVFAGFGGQGVMLAGKLLAETGMVLGKEVVWLPSYGPEMRGGTANCTVIVGDEPIASPIVRNPRDVAVMNRPSLDKFCPLMRPVGVAVVNKSLITVDPDRDDITVVNVPANQIAIEAGTGRAANMVMLGAYVGATDIVPFEALVEQVKHQFVKKAKLIPVNVKCLEEGYRLGQKKRA